MLTLIRQSQLFRRKWLLSGAAAICAASVVAMAYDDSANSDVGLNGIIAAFPPRDLDQDELTPLIDELDSSWQKWGAETAAAVKDFYEGDHPTIESQRLALARLQVKLGTMEKALGDRRYVSVHPEVSELYGRLAPRVAVAEAILDTLTADPEVVRQERLRDAAVPVKTAVAEVRKDLSSFNGGQQWVSWASLNELADVAKRAEFNEADLARIKTIQQKLAHRGDYAQSVKEFVSRESFLTLEDSLTAALKAVEDYKPVSQETARAYLTDLTEQLDQYDEEPTVAGTARIRELFDKAAQSTPDGGKKIHEALQAFYLNYNVQLTISEGLLKRVVAERREEKSRINERMMSARIVGSQVTTASVSADVQPSENGARFALVIEGNVRANTSGSVPEATIYSSGYHTFRAEKPVIFDGHSFTTEPATVRASANNRNYGAVTKYSGMPLFGGIANNIALNKADEQLGRANYITSQRIRTEVSSELNEQVDEQFSNAASELENKVYGPLREQGLYPEEIQVSSSDSAIFYRSRLIGAKEVAGSRLQPRPGSSKGLVVQVHESALTNGSARMELDGKTMSDGDVRKLIEERMSKLLNREVELPESPMTEAEPTTLVFADEDAVRFHVGEGEISLIIRAGLKREAGDIPTQVITVPLAFSVNNNEIVMNRGQVGVRPQPGQQPTNVAEQIARAKIMISKIEAAIPEKTFENKLELKLEERVVALKISSIEASSGWVTITAE